MNFVWFVFSTKFVFLCEKELFILQFSIEIEKYTLLNFFFLGGNIKFGSHKLCYKMNQKKCLPSTHTSCFRLYYVQVDEFLSIINFVWRAFIKECRAIYVVKTSWSGIAQRNKYTCLVLK
jgi:hypothetical protein